MTNDDDPPTMNELLRGNRRPRPAPEGRDPSSKAMNAFLRGTPIDDETDDGPPPAA